MVGNVSGWTWLFVGADSSAVFDPTTVTKTSMGLPAWNIEYEFLPGHVFHNAPTADTAAFVMDWLTLADARTLYRVAPGHWVFNGYNWNAMAPFAKLVLWDSVRLDVREDKVRNGQRIFAFRTPLGAGKGGPLHAGITPPGTRAFAVVNKDPQAPFHATVQFDDASSRPTTSHGHRCAGTLTDADLGTGVGGCFMVEVPPLATAWGL